MNINIPTPGPGEELVKALSPVEHDRISRVPGTDTALFALDSGAAETLERMGVIQRGTIDQLLAEYKAGQGGTQASSDVLQQVLTNGGAGFEGANAVTFADAADASASGQRVVRPLFDPEATLAVLADTQAGLAEVNAALDETREALAVRDTELAAAREQIDTLVAERQDAAATAGAGGAATGQSSDGGDAPGDAAADQAGDTTPKKPAAKKAAAKAK